MGIIHGLSINKDSAKLDMQLDDAYFQKDTSSKMVSLKKEKIESIAATEVTKLVGSAPENLESLQELVEFIQNMPEGEGIAEHFNDVNRLTAPSHPIVFDKDNNLQLLLSKFSISNMSTEHDGALYVNDNGQLGLKIDASYGGKSSGSDYYIEGGFKKTTRGITLSTSDTIDLIGGRPQVKVNNDAGLVSTTDGVTIKLATEVNNLNEKNGKGLRFLEGSLGLNLSTSMGYYSESAYEFNSHGIRISAIKGLCIATSSTIWYNDDGSLKVLTRPNGGIEVAEGGLSISVGDGITLTREGSVGSVSVKTGNGLTCTDSSVSVDTGKGLMFDAQDNYKLAIKLATCTEYGAATAFGALAYEQASASGKTTEGIGLMIDTTYFEIKDNRLCLKLDAVIKAIAQVN